MLCLTSLPVIKPKIRNNISIRERLGCFGFKLSNLWNGLIKQWIVLKGFLTKNNVSHEPNLETLLKEIEIWKTYLASFSNVKIEVRDCLHCFENRVNTLRTIFQRTFSENIVQKLFGRQIMIYKERLQVVVNVDFIYPNIALDSNIFFYIIKQNPVLCHLILPMEDKKLGLIHQREKLNTKDLLEYWRKFMTKLSRQLLIRIQEIKEAMVFHF